jgi:hypothetical protein
MPRTPKSVMRVSSKNSFLRDYLSPVAYRASFGPLYL